MRRIIAAIIVAIMFSVALNNSTGLPASAGAANSFSAQGVATVSINDASLIEGATGTNNMIFTVTLTAPGAHPTIGVAYGTADGPPPNGATVNVDYANTSGVLVFPADTGGASMTISVPINGDSDAEPDETLSVNLGLVDPPAGVTLGDGQGVGTIINDDIACSYLIVPQSESFGAQGHPGAVVVVETQIDCGWTATSNDSWITITSGSSGTGDGTVRYAVAANTGNARTGTMTIAGQTFTVNQQAPAACGYGIRPTSADFPLSGGNGSIEVETIGIGCLWSAVSDVPWIVIISGGVRIGNGAVSYAVSLNQGTARTGTITINGQAFTQRFTVNQLPSANCPSSIAPTVRAFQSVGGTGDVEVIAAATCPWSSISNDDWIAITSGASGAGNGVVSYSVAQNTGFPRIGSMTIAGQRFVVDQGSPVNTCTPPTLLGPVSREFSASGGPDRPAVSIPPGCNWTAVSNDSWITITLDRSAASISSFRYLVAENTGAARTGTITVIGDAGSATLTVNQQEAGRDCIYSITPTSRDGSLRGFSGSVIVDAQFGCEWSAVSNDPWIEIGFSFVTDGVGGVEYRVGENTGVARTGTMTIAGQTFTVRQAGCPVTLVTTVSEPHSYVGGEGLILLTSPGCRLTVVSNDPWITITSVDETLVKYKVAENPEAFRTGTISINGQVFTVTQFEAGKCDFSIDQTREHFTAVGTGFGFSTDTLRVTAPPGCKWRSVANANWINIETAEFRDGSGTVDYRVAPNPGPQVRRADIMIIEIDSANPTSQTLTIEQEGTLPPCVQEVSPAHQGFDGNSARFTVHVTAPPDCIWEPIVEAPWIKIPSISRGHRRRGSGDLEYAIESNPGGQRTAVIDFGGRLHTVTQGVGACPVELICQLLPSQCDSEESQARVFRDQVLSRTSRGQRYTQLYYQFSSEAVGVILLNPMMVLRSREMMERYMPVVRALVGGEQVTLTDGDIVEIDGFLRSFGEKAGPELRKAINGLCEDLRDPRVHSEFNITVTNGPKREMPVQGISQVGLMVLPFGLFLACLAVSSFRRRGVRTAIVCALCGAGSITAAGCQRPRSDTRNRPIPSAAAVNSSATNKAVNSLPLRFEANRGQTDPQVKFFARGQGYDLYLTPSEAVVATREDGDEERRRQSSSALRMKLIGSNAEPLIRGIGEAPSRSNYFIGRDSVKWRPNVPVYTGVEYEAVYPGIDMLYYGTDGELEYDFILTPGADPGLIKLGFEGAQGVEIDADGDLVLRTASGDLRQRKPVAYQEVNGIRQEIESRYYLSHNPESSGIHEPAVGVELGPYDPSKPLTIDPALAYSTYLGGSGNEEGNSVATDSAGNIYVSGFTDSINFPQVNASQPMLAGGRQDAFVVKLDPTGTQVLYSTYLGGDGQDNSTGIAVDDAGNVYITGFTDSTDFPVRNALQPAKRGEFNAFVVKLDPAGAILGSTLFGGSASDYASSIAVDSAGNVYFAGIATSPDLPVTSAVQQATGGIVDTFVAKIDSSGTRLLYSTYLGGVSMDVASSIAVDSAGNAYVTGLTSSTDFRTVNPLQASHGGGLFDAFVIKLDPSGTRIIYSTYLGGSGDDRAFRIAVDSNGSVYLTGDTDSANFPVVNAAQQKPGGLSDAFVVKLNASGNQLVYSTYLGGGGIDGGASIAVDTSGSAYVTGFTASADFPTSRPPQPIFGGAYDGFVAKLIPAGAALDYSSYLGGHGIDSVFGVAADASGNAYVMGVTDSTDFPTTGGPLQSGHGGGVADVFVSKIKPSGPSIERAEVQDKHLLVFGNGFDKGANIVIDGEVHQKTRNDEANPAGALLGKKAGKKIAPGRTVRLQVRNSDGGLSNELRFSRL